MTGQWQNQFKKDKLIQLDGENKSVVYRQMSLSVVVLIVTDNGQELGDSYIGQQVALQHNHSQDHILVSSFLVSWAFCLVGQTLSIKS